MPSTGSGAAYPGGALRDGLRVMVASSNQGKLREFREIAAGSNFEVEVLPGFDSLPPFDETAETFGENALGKALYYGALCDEIVMADDSGLIVPALGGAPGVRSARYAGPNATSTDRIAKLLYEMREIPAERREARFVCVIAAARQGRALAIVSDSVSGEIVGEARGQGGFGYDPIFLFPSLGRTMAELSSSEKNQYSHRGKAFTKLSQLLDF
jgi:XTP/dITP diphosphohydrolase